MTTDTSETFQTPPQMSESNVSVSLLSGFAAAVDGVARAGERVAAEEGS